MRVGVAGVPGAWSTEALVSALRLLGVESFSFSLASCLCDLTRGRVYLDGEDLSGLDGLMVKKLGPSNDRIVPSRVQLLRQLETGGLRVFSSAEAISRTVDRYRMTQRLTLAGVPIPDTVVTEDLQAAMDQIRAWGRAVLKPIFTSKGRGMLLLSSDDLSADRLMEWQRQFEMPFYLQRFVPNPGRDIGVAVLGGEVLAAFYRVSSDGSWLTTTSAGGHYERCPVNREMALLATLAAASLGLDYTVVDLVEGPSGYLVYEASAFGGFSGLWKCQQLDVAREYAAHAVAVLRKRGCNEHASGPEG